MKGGGILFRGSGTDARRYLESDRSRADEYYLEGRVALAEFSVVDGTGAVIGERPQVPVNRRCPALGSVRGLGCGTA